MLPWTAKQWQMLPWATEWQTWLHHRLRRERLRWPKQVPAQRRQALQQRSWLMAISQVKLPELPLISHEPSQRVFICRICQESGRRLEAEGRPQDLLLNRGHRESPNLFVNLRAQAQSVFMSSRGCLDGISVSIRSKEHKIWKIRALSLVENPQRVHHRLAERATVASLNFYRCFLHNPCAMNIRMLFFVLHGPQNPAVQASEEQETFWLS